MDKQFMNCFPWDVITHSCPDFKKSLAEPPFYLHKKHGWLIISHLFMNTQLLFDAQKSRSVWQFSIRQAAPNVCFLAKTCYAVLLSLASFPWECDSPAFVDPVIEVPVYWMHVRQLFPLWCYNYNWFVSRNLADVWLNTSSHSRLLDA